MGGSPPFRIITPFPFPFGACHARYKALQRFRIPLMPESFSGFRFRSCLSCVQNCHFFFDSIDNLQDENVFFTQQATKKIGPRQIVSRKWSTWGGGGGVRGIAPTKFSLKGALFLSHLTIVQSRRQEGLLLALV